MHDAQLAGFLDRPGLQPEHDRSTIDRRAIQQELQETRTRGYSLNREAFLPGLIAIGAPVFNRRSGKVVGGVSFDSSTARYSIDAFEKQYATLLVELAKKISAALSV
jgi:IclR family pca regulon transcriptional regulator